MRVNRSDQSIKFTFGSNLWKDKPILPIAD